MDIVAPLSDVIGSMFSFILYFLGILMVFGMIIVLKKNGEPTGLKLRKNIFIWICFILSIVFKSVYLYKQNHIIDTLDLVVAAIISVILCVKLICYVVPKIK